MPSLTTSNRVRVFEEATVGAVVFTPTGLVATGAAGVDGCIVQFNGDVQSVGHAFCPEEPRNAGQLVHLPALNAFAAAVVDPAEGRTDIRVFGEAELELKGMLYRTTASVQGLAGNADGTKL